jgi:hypothetical protein
MRKKSEKTSLENNIQLEKFPLPGSIPKNVKLDVLALKEHRLKEPNLSYDFIKKPYRNFLQLIKNWCGLTAKSDFNKGPLQSNPAGRAVSNDQRSGRLPFL